MEIPAIIQMGLFDRPLVTEPLVCKPCASWSLANCPGLMRQRSDRSFRMYEVWEYVIVQQWLKPSGENDGAEVDAALIAFGAPAVGYLKLALTKCKELSTLEVAA